MTDGDVPRDAGGEEVTATEVAPYDPERTLERLRSRPAIDWLNPRQLTLLKTRAARNAKNVTHGELGQYVELCVAYGLDPYASEAWLTKDDKGRVMIMVGRDGLRKIAQRNGLDLDGDVVREKDEFRVERGPDRARQVTHSYSGTDKTRGAIVGAWAEAWERRTGRQVGYFYAPLSEYRPTSAAKLQYSPWGSQESVMILAAAERQAARQGTPLSGIVAEGEFDRMEEQHDLTGGAPQGEHDLGAAPWVATDEFGDEVGGAVERVIARAADLGHPGYSDRATVEMTLADGGVERAAEWVEAATRELDAIAADVVDADVVEPESNAAPDDPVEAAEAAADAFDEEESNLVEQRDLAEEAGDHEEVQRLEGELAVLRSQRDATADPAQDRLL